MDENSKLPTCNLLVLPISLGSDMNISKHSLVHRENRGPLDQVKTVCVVPKMGLKSRWRSHESGAKPRPLASDSPIQSIPLLRSSPAVSMSQKVSESVNIARK